ncbi:EAL domain-containing protein [Tamilnaduibacter salinus]|uniref:EAL domain-containing protein n=1 Tax=Tamilnaduibacter salinus TaxID=1484056 RepID=UPI0013046945|nr:EAL domain-containing protein [Tamilnaduibacter salinus]
MLLVEDNPADADLCQLYLREAFGLNLDVFHVTCLAQAERLVEQQRIDVTLLDLGLPDSSGVSSVVRLQSQAPDVPIVVLTGTSDTQLGVDVIRKKAQEFCPKQSLNADVLMQSIRHAMERHRLQTQYSRVLETSPDGIVVVDRNQRLLYINQSGAKLLQLSVPDDIGKRCPPRLLPSGRTAELVLPQARMAEVRTADLDWDQAPATLIAYHDITDRKEAEHKLQQMVRVDQLTGLFSRSHFFEHLDRLIAWAQREAATIALLFIDLDRFKYINDTLGHQAGDYLLQQVGERIRQNTRASDFVARLGGDEFALVYTGMEQPGDAAYMAEKLIDRFRAPIDIHGSQVGIGLSIGISTYPHCGRDAQTLYSGADTAMYQAKAQGQNHYHFFSEALQEQVELRLSHEQAVRRVVQDKRLSLVYQPQINVQTGQAVSIEALLRWPDDDSLGLSPAQFIPIMEDTGLIEQVGIWVVEQAAEQILALGHQIGRPIRVAVNVSMRQLYDERFFDQVTEVLRRTGLPADQLELELTESVLMDDPGRTRDTLEAFRRLGVSIAIDDFGTGYSSLSYLRRLPVNVLKIDRSFVVEIGHNPESESILHSLINLAGALGLRVVAEGVEHPHEHAFLRQAGCDELQGYHLCKPMSMANLTDWLHRQGDG